MKRLIWLAVFVVGCAGLAKGTNEPTQPAATIAPAAATPRATFKAFGPRDAIVSFVSDLGFTGQENTLNDGRPRWLGHRADGATFEAIGPATDVTEMSLSIVVQKGAGTLTGLLLQQYAPGSLTWVGQQTTSLAGGGSGGTKRFADVNVTVDGLLASDGLLATISLKHR